MKEYWWRNSITIQEHRTLARPPPVSLLHLSEDEADGNIPLNLLRPLGSTPEKKREQMKVLFDLLIWYEYHIYKKKP